MHGASFTSARESTTGLSSSIKRPWTFLHAITSPQALGVLYQMVITNFSCSIRTNFRVIRFFNCSFVLHNEPTDEATFTHLRIHQMV